MVEVRRAVVHGMWLDSYSIVHVHCVVRSYGHSIACTCEHRPGSVVYLQFTKHVWRLRENRAQAHSHGSCLWCLGCARALIILAQIDLPRIGVETGPDCFSPSLEITSADHYCQSDLDKVKSIRSSALRGALGVDAIQAVQLPANWFPTDRRPFLKPFHGVPWFLRFLDPILEGRSWRARACQPADARPPARRLSRPWLNLDTGLDHG